MATPIKNAMTDNSVKDGTGDKINGTEVDANPNALADILDGTTATPLNQATNNPMEIRNPILGDASAAAGGVRTAARFRHNPSSGTVTDNDGVEVLFQGDDDGGTVTNFGEIEVVFTDVSDTTEDADMVFKTMLANTSTEMLSIGSTGFIFNESGADLDARFEGDTDANLLYIDAGEDEVYIGGATDSAINAKFEVQVDPSAKNAFSIAGEGANTNAAVMAFYKTRNASVDSHTVVVTGDGIGNINWAASDGSSAINAASIRAAVEGTVASTRVPGRLTFHTGTDAAPTVLTERMRIDSAGDVMIGNTTAGTRLQVSDSDDSLITQLHATHATYTSAVLRTKATRSANAAYNLLDMFSGNTGDKEFQFTGAGEATADGSFTGSGADYQEFFESVDGSALPVGKTVVLVGDKVALADDHPLSPVLGVVRPKEWNKNSAVIGNAAWNYWTDKYLTDDYGRYVTEAYTAHTWTDSDGVVHIYEEGRIPDGVTIPADATAITTESDGVTPLVRKKLNPAYTGPTTTEDPNYIPRKDRDEWNLIGLLGQVQVETGQRTDTRWIKMADISPTVELWMVR